MQVYDLFDDIFLLANGRTLYQGPRESVEPHFKSLGFEVIGKKAVADFLQVCMLCDCHMLLAHVIGTALCV
jgi:ABC-2 type transporter